MRLHASCAARPAATGHDAVLLRGPSGSGKSDLLLRLLSRGFVLVADDQVLVEAGMASPPLALAGILEVRGLGLFRLPHIAAARLRLVVTLGAVAARLPEPALDPVLNIPAIALDPAAASAPDRIALALDAATGRIGTLAGAFAL